MALLQTNFISEQQASGAQIIDGSLRFDKSKTQFLEKTFASAGDRKTWTYSAWFKRGTTPSSNNIWAAYNGSFSGLDNFGQNYWDAADGRFVLYQDGGAQYTSAGRYREHSGGWYHLVIACDVTQSSYDNRYRVYVNNFLNNSSSGTIARNTDLAFNNNIKHYIGTHNGSGELLDGNLAQVYFIDGYSLYPDQFGFTDPLTNTWRPKAYITNLGTKVNNGIVWSDSWDGTGSTGTVDNPARAFNGDLTNYTSNKNSGTICNWVPSAPIPIKRSLRIYASAISSGNNQVFVNGTSIGTVTGTAQWYSIQATELTSVGLQDIGSTHGYLHAIEVDGVILLDSSTSNSTDATYPFGTNGFYLPMDGNSPIGQDKSGRGNDWTPVNFGGSNSLEKATGALPILNTVNGGTQAGVGIRTDAFASNLVLSIPFVGSNNDLSNQTNGGSTTKSITVNGAVASNAYSNFYGGSYLFDGTNDYLALTDSADFAYGTGDFTIESWIYPTDISNYKNFYEGNTDGSTNASVRLQIKSTGVIEYVINNVGRNSLGGAAVVPANAWTHVALTRASNTVRLFVNGVNVDEYTNSGDLTSQKLHIGKTHDNYYYVGNIQDYRVYKGVAKYTSNFIPASTNPDILPETPSGVSGNSKLTKITEGAVSFDGADDYLTLAGSSDFSFGTGDFTVEWTMWSSDKTANGVYNRIFCNDGPTGDSNGNLQFNIDEPTGALVIWKGTSPNVLLGTINLCDSSWHHVAVTRSGTTLRIFVDGVQDGSVSNSTDWGTHNSGAPRLHIGSRNGTGDYKGFLSNYRIIKGTALYTANFTPPTSPLTNVTNTKLLCCQSNTEAGFADVAPNVSGINNGTQWSHYLTGAGGFQGSYPATNAFNGTISASETSRSTNSGETQTFAPPVGIPYSSKVEVWTWYTGNVSLNGGSNVAVSDDQDWRTIATGSGTLNSLAFIGDSGNNIYLAGIRIDSTTILLDPIAPKGNAEATTFNPFNTDINTVRGQETGYATLNPLDNEGLTLSDGNLNVTNMGSARQVHANIFVNSGKWYAEFICKAAMNDTLFGVANINGTSYLGADANSWGVISINGNRINGNSQSSYGSSFTAGDVISIALDMDSGKWYAAKNGLYFGNGNPLTGANPAYSGLTGDLTFAVGSNSANGDVSCNFGQKPFKFPPPDGFQPLNIANARPETTIVYPDQFVGVATFRGNGSSVVVSDYKFKPDLVWIKGYTDADRHGWYDTVRGVQKRLQTAHNTGEDTQNGVMTFEPNGFSVGDYAETNGNNRSYVGWCWKAGGNKNTFNVDDVGYASAAAAGLDSGSINPTGASVGTKEGFSIIKITTPSSDGAYTVSHGLTKAPQFIIYRIYDQAMSWYVWHEGYGAANKYMLFNANSAVNSGTYVFNNTLPTASVITDYAGNSNHHNEGRAMMYYSWHDVPGLQKFGTYEGNGSTDGPFVELGFKPAVLILKNMDDTENWYVYDLERSKTNVAYQSLQASQDAAEETGNTNTRVDILSNGFKLRQTNGPNNSHTYIYMAWAEVPSFNLYGAQSNAR
jgi:hypothetical protein